MKHSSLPQLLAAPAVAGILLFSSVDSAQAKSYNSNELISSAAIGIFFDTIFSGIAAYVASTIDSASIPLPNDCVKYVSPNSFGAYVA